MLKEEGETLPDADLLVASTAIAYDLVLKSGDGHFERLEE
ncbi:twitching motility protein PilT, partial [candidate division MSBL1 archaeon SCGC-AAA259E22]